MATLERSLKLTDQHSAILIRGGWGALSPFHTYEKTLRCPG